MTDAVLQEAAELLRSGHAGQALALFKPAFAPRKSEPWAYKLLGDRLYEQQAYREAIAAYEQAIVLDPDFVEALFNLGAAYKAIGAYDEARDRLSRADRAQPGSAAILRRLGDVCFLLNRFDESLAHYDAALAKAPDDRSARYGRERAAIACAGKLDDPATVFAAIYANDAWGNLRNQPQKFFSGEGSHVPRTVEAYVSAVTRFLQSLGPAPDVVDIGCGDFNIGSKIRPACGRYLALDVVADLVAYNAERFVGLDVEFAQLDVTREAPRPAQVYFIREVFQHLSNAQIAKALANIEGRFQHLIFTEAVPKGDFTPNIDKSSGERARFYVNESGVVLTQPPFNARFVREAVLCSVERKDGSVVVTRAYSTV